MYARMVVHELDSSNMSLPAIIKSLQKRMQCSLTCSGCRSRGGVSAPATVTTISGGVSGAAPESWWLSASGHDRREGGRQGRGEVGVAGDRGGHGLQRRPVPAVQTQQRRRRPVPSGSREAVHRERRHGRDGRQLTVVLEQTRGRRRRRRRRRVREVEGDGRERRGGGERGAAHGGRVGVVVLEEQRRGRDVVSGEERARVVADGRARQEHGRRGGGRLGHRRRIRRQLVVVRALVRGDQHRLVLRAPLHLHIHICIARTRVCPLVTDDVCSFLACMQI